MGSFGGGRVVENSMAKGLASIIIRTKNEEKWISHCLQNVFQQEYTPGFEVIIVDNRSTDNTRQLARRFPIKTIVDVDDFFPGKSLNTGIEHAGGEFIVCVSAHCVPKSNSWLARLLKNFIRESVAGVYGRQVPVTFSNPSDVRDMYITFGLDRRVQKKDTFFHNANSAIRRSVLDGYPFDEQITNIEDRMWAKVVLDNGYEIVYEPGAEVYHHHGIHQTQDIKRIKQTFMVLNEHEDFSVKDSLPDSMKPENRSIACLVPIPQEISNIVDTKDLNTFFSEVKSSKFIKSVHILFDDPKLKEICDPFEFDLIQRPEKVNLSDVTLDMVLAWGLEEIEDNGFHSDIVIYTNPIYRYRPKGLFDELIYDICYKGLDTVFAGFVDYQNYWAYDEVKGYHQVGEGLLPRQQKHPIYKALFGLGCVSTAHVIRQEKLIGETIGIIPVNDVKYTLKINDQSSRSVISMLHPEKTLIDD